MQETKGVILQDRNILDSPIMSFANAFQLYIYLKLRAEYKPTHFYFGYQKIDLIEGQVLFKQSRVAEELNMPKGSIKKVLTTLVNEGLIGINKTTNKYTIVTIQDYHIDFEQYKQNKNKTKTKDKQNKSVSTNSPKLPLTPLNSPIYTSEFLEFWKEYPKKVKKPKASDAYKKAVKTTDKQVILEGLRKYVEKWTVEKTERKYIPHATTWLNGGQWGDEIVVDSKKSFDKEDTDINYF